MKSNLIKLLTIALTLVFITSCDRPVCKNTNPVFEKFSPETKEYKDELVKQLKQVNNSKLTYWLDKYQESDAQEFLYIFIQGDGLCAKGVVTVNQWNKLEGIKRTKGKGYVGAKLKNLKLDIYQDSANTELVYKDVDRIID